MRGIKSNKTILRQSIFTEVAKAAYEGKDANAVSELNETMVDSGVWTYPGTVETQKKVTLERIKAAMGLDGESDLNEAFTGERIRKGAQVTVIADACNACVEKKVYVTEGCQGCLEHPCTEVCPRKAVSLKDGHSFIDQSLCIKCGKCHEACSYNAIIIQERPCSKACGVKAIGSDENGKAKIDPAKCVSCGQCMVSCPFSAIIDKGQLFQLITSMNRNEKVYAMIAPSIFGQFPKMTEGKIRSAFKALGFEDVIDVSIGADICTLQETRDFLKEVPAEIPYMETSCCPAWTQMIRNEFPDQAKCISGAFSPMVITARMIKDEHPEAKTCFVGPCVAKKLEAAREDYDSYTDFVITFEELNSLFEARNVDFDALEDTGPYRESSADGRGFAAGGGVASAVVNYVKDIAPETEMKVVNAMGLDNCKKLMLMVKANRHNGYLIEGMACPGGCITGAGTIQSQVVSQKGLTQAQKETDFTGAKDTKYADRLEKVENIGR